MDLSVHSDRQKGRERPPCPLRCQKKRKQRYGSPDQRGQLKKRVSIDERPAIVDERQRSGDWEMDLIIGRLGGSVLMTAVERKTGFTVIALAPNKTAEAVKEAILGALSPLAAPTGSSFDDMTPECVQRIFDKLNNRPRKCLDFKTPNQVLFGINPPIALAS